jgi:uncharacterized surface protein with fasciclin (FAS1) repeats
MMMTLTQAKPSVAFARSNVAKSARRSLSVLAAEGGGSSKGGEEGGKKFDRSCFGVIASNANYMILGSLITKAGLEETLTDPNGKFTVFAPDDDAFAAAAKKLGTTKLGLADLPNLADVLKNHVVSGEVKSTDLTEGGEVATLGANPIKATLAGGAKVNGAKVKKADIKVTNGIIHAITEVLL